MLAAADLKDAIGLAIPVGTAVVAYFFQLWCRILSSRKRDSALAVAYLSEINHEIETGIERLEYLFTHGGVAMQFGNYKPIMPTQNWTSVRDIIPDQVFARICNVCKHSGLDDVADIRWHLKNYYTVIAKYGNGIIDGTYTFDMTVTRIDLDGARGVRQLLLSVKARMERNSCRLVWAR